jgi:hypothetical protein
LEKERKNFIEEMFGRDFPQDSRLLRERFGALIRDGVDQDGEQ